MISGLRKKINRIDKKLMKLLIKRYVVVKKIGKFKNESGIPVVDKEREQEIVKKIDTLKTEDGAKRSVKEIYKCIFSASHRAERAE